ncbi:MAG: bifunctional diguanylate cyclase/phosphohydrolase [Solirubrobacterales bacterium]
MAFGDRNGEAGTFGLLSGPRGPPSGTNPRTYALSRAQAYIFVAAGACGFAVLAFPHPPQVSDLAAVPIAIVAILSGAALYRLAARVPARLLVLTPALGTLLATGAVLLSGSAISAYTLYYLWAGFYCFYFLARGQAIAHLAFIGLNFALAVAVIGIPSMPQENADVSFFILSTGTIANAGLLLLYLRSRVEGLVGELSGAALTDPLTGQPNRRAFREALEAEIERAHPEARPVSVLAIDGDRLESLNEALGHDGADRVLIAIGELLDGGTRRIDTVARMGSGGFGVLLPDVDEGEAYMTAEELLTGTRRALRRAGRAAVTISIGVATYPRRAADPEGLLSAADRALFTAKVLGRDRAVLSSPEVEELLTGVSRRPPGESMTHLKTLLSLAEALDLRDRRTAHHAETVGSYAERIARELGMSEPRVARIRLAGFLHDIGRVGIPDSIVFKQGPLDPEEWEQMKRHPEIGARILGSSDLADIREWVLCSHEQPDGRGYPRGLAGDQIPIEARILGVADAFEAMIFDRVYRPAIGAEAARVEFRREAGRSFDGEVVEALLAIIDREPVAQSVK